jgi:hypothetical protein
MLRAPLISHFPPITEHSTHHLRQSSNENQPFSFLILISSFCFGKLLVSTCVLLTNETEPNKLKTWLELATLCDLINAILIIIEIRYFLSKHRARMNRTTLYDEESLDQDQTPTTMSSQNKIIKKVLTFNNCFYLALWGWGHDLYYRSPDEYLDQFQVISNLVFLYLYCGYFFIACSLLMAIFSHSCISFFQFSQISLATRSQTKWPLQKLLSVKTYSTASTGPTECYICLLNYKEGDNLVELPCNFNHHFHEACITKWLKINNACPLCRKVVDNTSQNTAASNEIELPVILV